jgi:uncharacterized protein
MKSINFRVDGMTCKSCEKTLDNQLSKLDGVIEHEIDFVSETAKVSFNPKKISKEEIFSKIEEKGYSCSTKKSKSWFGWAFGIMGIIIAFYFLIQLTNKINLPEISQNMSYGLLFVVGLLTGFHCISMCGGFVISYTAKDAKEGKKSYKSHFLYGSGKLISYTLIGAFFGLIGSIIAFTPMMRGIAGLLAGLFLILFGLKMLNFIPLLRHLQFKTPKFLNKFIGEKQNSSPLVIGLLNGLMIACGPLQAIYIMAAGTGSVLEGAKLLFFFALGTLPVMIGFGFFATLVSSKLTHKILKASGVIVIILGIIMINNGLALTGSGYDFNSVVTSVSANAGISDSESIPTITNGYQEIRMTVDNSGWTPDKFILQKDIPVKWIIEGVEINGCNNAIQVPSLGLNFDIELGEQIIEFTPTEEGIIAWSCWMGMIPGTFIVTEDINNEEAQETLDTVELPTGGCGCGGGCGG